MDEGQIRYSISQLKYKHKKQLRKHHKSRRRTLEKRTQKSNKAFKLLYKQDEYKEAGVIGIYKSFGQELQTKLAIKQMLADGKRVCYPVVDEKIEGLMVFKDSNGVLVNPKEIDLMVCPAICVDIIGNRIGYGKGYYDRYMVGQRFKKVAIIFHNQLETECLIDVDQDDVPMDKIVTNFEVVDCIKNREVLHDEFKNML